MSDESPASPNPSSDSEPAAEPRPPAQLRTKKAAGKSAAKSARKGAAKPLKAEKPDESPSTADELQLAKIGETPSIDAPEPPMTAEAPLAGETTLPAVGDDWPEPESSQSAAGQAEGPKRKRRRRKGKGSAQGGTGENGSRSENGTRPENLTAGERAGEENSRPTQPSSEESDHHLQRQRDKEDPRPAPPAAPRRRVDPEALSKRAWKIFLAEVSEEGVALIGDQDAKELSRRCFRLAEIFLDEQARRPSGQ